MSPPTPHVLIIGAGLCGLALAQGLKKKNISFRVYERDPTPDHRRQGYRLKLFGESIAALRSVLPPELWLAFQSTCAETTLGETDFNALNGNITASRASWPGPPPNMADRNVLRNILLHGLGDTVVFNKAFSHYMTDSGTVTASFTDGSSATGTLLVGADGIHSRVRAQFLPSLPLLDTQGVCIYGESPLTPALEARIPPKALRWMTIFMDPTPTLHSVITGPKPLSLILDTMRFPSPSSATTSLTPPSNYVYWAFTLHGSLLGSNLHAALSQPASQLALSLTSEWDPSLRSLLELQDPSLTQALQILSAPPHIEPWSPSARVTLMGDAIHPMSPTGGVGAVTALIDARELVSAIAGKEGGEESEKGDEGPSQEAIGRYEAKMRANAEISIKRSFAGGKEMFNQPPFEQCEAVGGEKTG